MNFTSFCALFALLVLTPQAPSHDLGQDLIKIAGRGDAAEVRVLLQEGADPNRKDQQNRTALMVAAENGHLEVVELLLKAGAAVDATTVVGSPGFELTVQPSALVHAIWGGQAAVVKVLLAAGANPRQMDQNRMTVLELAASNGKADIVRLLFAAFRDPSERAEQGVKAMRTAAVLGKIDVLKRLLDSGADVNWLDGPGGATPLMSAAAGGYPDEVRLLLEAGANVKSADAYGFTALTCAATNKTNNADVLRKLLAAGAGVNARAKANISALMVASLANDPEGVQVLLQAKAEVNANTGGGLTPLMLAAVTGNQLIIKHLLDAGADPQARDEDGWTALNWAGGKSQVMELLTAAGAKETPGLIADAKLMNAVAKGDAASVRSLVSEGARVNARALNGYTPLGRASVEGQLEVVKTLLDAGANVNQSESIRPYVLYYAASAERNVILLGLLEVADKLPEGPTPLQLAARYGHIPVVKLLLEAKADVNAGEGSQPALLLALEERVRAETQGSSLELVKLLLASGANVNARDSDGMTALMKAAFSGNVEVVRALLAAGAEPHLRDKMGHTALDWAKTSRNQAVLELLEKSS